MLPADICSRDCRDKSSYGAAFSGALIDPERATPNCVAGRNGKTATKRYNVYRNNVTVGLIEALASIYPAVQRITGAEFFRAMARFHVRANPPRSPLLFEYGRDFPGFIERYEYARSLPWLADVARIAVGAFGAALVAVGALVSFYGYLSAKILGMPRVTYALAEQGDFPKVFASIHPRFHTPYVSILVFAALVWAFALSGEFQWNVTLSAVARLLYYAVCCAALPVLRRKQPGKAGFRLPAGNILAVVAVLMCAALVTRVDFGQSLIVAATIALGLLNWFAVRNREPVHAS